MFFKIVTGLLKAIKNRVNIWFSKQNSSTSPQEILPDGTDTLFFEETDKAKPQSLPVLPIDTVTFNFSNSDGQLKTAAHKEEESTLVTTSLALAEELMTIRQLENEDISNKKKWWSYKNPTFIIIVCMITSIIFACGFWIKFLVFSKNTLVPSAPIPLENKLNTVYKWKGEKYIHPFYFLPTAFTPPLLSVIFYDVGLKEDITEKAIDELPLEIALAFSCYAVDLKKQLDYAHENAFLTLVCLPLFSSDASLDLGNLTFLTEKSSPDFTEKWLEIWESSQNTPYVLLQGGDFFQFSEDYLTPLLHELKKQKKALFTSSTPLLSPLFQFSSQYKIPHYPITHWVSFSNCDNLEEILINAEETALSMGYAIVALPLTNFTLSYIIEWTNNREEDTLPLTPLWKIYGHAS